VIVRDTAFRAVPELIKAPEQLSPQKDRQLGQVLQHPRQVAVLELGEVPLPFTTRCRCLNTEADFCSGVKPRRATARRLAPLRPRSFFRPARPRRLIAIRDHRTASRTSWSISLRTWMSRT
jgi:hypothetical protein